MRPPFAALALALAAAALATGCGDDVLLGPCETSACALPPPPRCDGNAVVVTAPPRCTADGDRPLCAYDQQRTACPAGRVCYEGGCHADPCAGVTCDAPPAPSCAGTVLTTFGAAGSCAGTTGAAICTYPPTTTDCAVAGQVCVSDACVAP